jgi:hypothetical protein
VIRPTIRSSIVTVHYRSRVQSYHPHGERVVAAHYIPGVSLLEIARGLNAVATIGLRPVNPLQEPARISLVIRVREVSRKRDSQLAPT